MNRRWLTGGAIGAGVLVAAILAVLAFQSMSGPLATSLGIASPSPGACAPTPCTNVEGYTLWVSNLTIDGNLVRMQVKFQNSSDSTHASPDDLSLVDASHNTSRLVTDVPNCDTWNRHEFNGGATFGPIAVCFRVSNTKPPFTLHWTPDFGFFCCETDLTISPT